MDPEKQTLLLLFPTYPGDRDEVAELPGDIAIPSQPQLEEQRLQRRRPRVLFFLLPLVAIATVFVALTHSSCWTSSPGTTTGKHLHAQSEHGQQQYMQPVQSRSPLADGGNLDIQPGSGDVVPYAATTTTTTAPTPTRTVLKCFEVDQPVLLPDGPEESDGSSKAAPVYAAESCTVLLMRRDFAWSYEDPFVGVFFLLLFTLHLLRREKS